MEKVSYCVCYFLISQKAHTHVDASELCNINTYAGDVLLRDGES
jgi:hypothetical protein